LVLLLLKQLNLTTLVSLLANALMTIMACGSVDSMSNPYALPHQTKTNPLYDALGYLLGFACVLETLGVWGMPIPPLAAFYGIAATYILRR